MITVFKYAFLIVQGALVGHLAGQVFADGSWQFWVACIANSLSVVAYGATVLAENNG